jgi:two-component system chemotaxis sensor kinase CheA
MSTTSDGVADSALNDVVSRLDDLEAQQPDSVAALRSSMRRVVVDATVGGSVKAFIIQAMLLLDDPRVEGGAGGAALLAKVRKLIESAHAAHAEHSEAHAAVAPATSGAFSPDALLSPDTDPAIVAEFVRESREQLSIAEAALLGLDGDPDDLDALDTLFRALHTIKGTSASLGVEHAAELAHHAESLLTRVRSGAAVCTGELSNHVFRSIDMLDAMLVAIECAADGETAMLPDGFRALVAVLRAGPSSDREDVSVHGRSSGQMRRLRFTDTMVRVRSTDLDRLVGVVRELVLTHAMLSRDNSLRSVAHEELGRKIAHAERLAFELDEVATELRTVTFAATMQRLARLTRDVAYQSGKSIELATDGEAVIIERAMADALTDPLLHMVRNAIDHGIESTEERRRLGKPEAGQLRIMVQRVGAQLVIEVSDDGRGLRARELERVAIDRGLIDADAELSDEEAFALIFRPGFTTAAVVTELSGRGVGMDVVRTNVEGVGGTIGIASRVNEGTTFTIRLPFRSQPPRGRLA